MKLFNEMKEDENSEKEKQTGERERETESGSEGGGGLERDISRTMKKRTQKSEL